MSDNKNEIARINELYWKLHDMWFRLISRARFERLMYAIHNNAFLCEEGPDGQMGPRSIHWPVQAVEHGYSPDYIPTSAKFYVYEEKLKNRYRSQFESTTNKLRDIRAQVSMMPDEISASWHQEFDGFHIPIINRFDT